jgi:peptidoglycan/LPS O-acetylase OafA/YrhL
VEERILAVLWAGGVSAVKYNPALDGVRAIAVTGVILYHAWPSAFPGGWIGVSVFFVVSGWLITSLLVAENNANGHIAIGPFLVRRAVRLLPALWVALGFTMFVAVVLYPLAVAGTGRQAVATVLDVSNWAMVSGFVTDGLLGHTWSLSVEEQFYLVWPVVLLVLLLARPRWAALACVGLLAAAVVDNLLLPWGSYYRTDTAAAGLLLGCCTALASRATQGRLRSRSRGGAVIGGVGALACMVALVTLVRPGDASGAIQDLVADAIAAVFVLPLAVAPVGALARLLSSRPVVWLGRRSYAAYLYSYPVQAVVVALLGIGTGVAVATLTFVATLLLSAASWRLVEVPTRRLRTRWGVTPARRALAVKASHG